LQDSGSLGLLNLKIIILAGLIFILCGCRPQAPIKSEPTPKIPSPYETMNPKMIQAPAQEPVQKSIQDLVQEKATATIVEDAVPAHHLPLLRSEIIATLSKNSNYLISGRSSSGLWMALSSADLPNGQGWVSTRYLAVVGSITEIEITDVPDVDPVIAWDVATIDIEEMSDLEDTIERADRLNVRIAPEPYARIVGYVDNGETYPILNRTEDGLWLQIPGTETLPTDNPVGGWIATTYATIGQQSVNAHLDPIKFISQPFSNQETVVINVPNGNRLLVRNAPRPDGKVMGYVSDGEIYRILDQSEEYAWVLIDGGRDEEDIYSGWISGQFVSIQRPEPIYRPLVAYTSFSVPQDLSIQIQSGAPVLSIPQVVTSTVKSTTVTSTIVKSTTVKSFAAINVAISDDGYVDSNFIYQAITPLTGSIRLAGKLILNVRYAPTQQSAVIGYVYNSEPINIQGYTADGQWYLVTGRAKTANPYGGWVASDLITLQDGLLDIEIIFPDEALLERMSPLSDSRKFDATLFFHSNKYRYALVNTEGLPLRIRAEPNTTSDVLTFAQAGELYIISSYTKDGLWIEPNT